MAPRVKLNRNPTRQLFRLGMLAVIVFSALLPAMPASAANVIITEVLYDPLNESGGEAVELYNPSDEPINIGGWVLTTESSSSDATFPPGTFIMPRSYFLVADSGWSFISSVGADYEEAISLANSDAGVGIASNGTLIDAVGWGNPAGIGSGLFEAVPASPASEGASLQRIYNGSYRDSSNNSADFISGLPDFRNSSSSGFEIAVYALITGSSVSVSNLSVHDDDNSSAGIQVIPFAGSNRTVRARVVVSGSQNATVAGIFNNQSFLLNRTSEINATSAFYEANFSVPYYLNSGIHYLNVTAIQGSNSTISLPVEVMGLLALDIDSPSLRFSGSPGSFSDVEGDHDSQTLGSVTVRNIGNSALRIMLSATNLTYGSSSIDAGSMRYSFGSSYSGTASGQLSNSRQLANFTIRPGASASAPLSFRLDIPQQAASGNYTGRIFLYSSS